MACDLGDLVVTLKHAHTVALKTCSSDYTTEAVAASSRSVVMTIKMMQIK